MKIGDLVVPTYLLGMPKEEWHLGVLIERCAYDVDGESTCWDVHFNGTIQIWEEKGIRVVS